MLLAAFAVGVNIRLAKQAYINFGLEDSFAMKAVQNNPHPIVPTRTGGMGAFALHAGLHFGL